jgi:hypothetical protein
MRGVTGSKPSNLSSNNIGGGSSKNLFSRPQKQNAPLGRSIRGKAPQPSRLSRQIVVEDEEDELPVASDKQWNRAGTFAMDYDDTYDDSDDDDALPEPDQQDTMGRDADADVAADAEDLWLGMQQDAGNDVMFGDDSDLMLHVTPAANARVLKEAEDIFRMSTAQQAVARRREHKFAPLAKDLYTQMGYAPINESPELIVETEAQLSRLYDDGVGVTDDAEKLDETLASVAANVAKQWQAYANTLPRSDKEHPAVVGPGPDTTPFEKANFLANLALQLHHTRFDDDDRLHAEPLTETLFRWQDSNHNFYPAQFDEIKRHNPSPACHSLFWQTVFISLLRGRVGEARTLLEEAGWGHVRKGHRGDYAYTGQSLSNVERAVADTCDMLEDCPGMGNNWDIFSSDWTLFRVRARTLLERLRRFAEGRDSTFGDSTSTAFADSYQGQQSLAGMARKAESQVPWDIYENLNIVFEIVMGSRNAILAAAVDWCEATVGLFGWWDESKTDKPALRSSSQGLLLPSLERTTESYYDRLARSFQTAEAVFPINTFDPIHVGMACIFEDNAKGLIGILRAWSLPIAAAVAEIASLGGWLPPHQRNALFGMEDLDMDDLDVLGMDPGSPDEFDGIKDNTLVTYAQELANFKELATVKDKSGAPLDGWELAIRVLGRMDSSERSEETVQLLVQELLQHLDVDSGTTVDKVWRLLGDLGMLDYAQETAEVSSSLVCLMSHRGYTDQVQTYGEILARDSHRYGEAMWYYALAHKPAKVREVMNLLISYSLLQSTPYPPNNDLDDHLHKLLANRNETLKDFASQDLEAAELLGKMLSGYASLRQFYELRDDEGNFSEKARRQQAIAALTSVIASADDNIRGGLLDSTRDAIVSEDFLLALLGEASVFISGPDHAFHTSSTSAAINLDQIDVLLKAIEDLQSVGDRVYKSAEEFFQLVLQGAPGGLKGSTPADLMRKSGTGSFVLAGSESLVGQLKRSISGGQMGRDVRRGWDWRKETVSSGITGRQFLQRLRVGITKDLARLWLEEADGGMWA